MKRVVALAAVAFACATGCGHTDTWMPDGTYSGSTADNQAVNIVVGDTITLDGQLMKHRPDGWFEAEKNHDLKMKCKPQAHDTELSCTFRRGSSGFSETVELMKL